MKRFTRNVLIGAGIAGGCAVGGYYYFYEHYNNKKQSDKPVVPKLTAEEFNALQDSAFRKTALSPHHLPWTAANGKQPRPSPDDCEMRFYRLLGCPYCAKVNSVLRYHRVPFEETVINPLNGDGLPDARYDLAPQIKFTRMAGGEGEKKDSVLLVDSAFIIDQLAAPLGYTKDIQQSADPNTNISATRKWISSHFHSASFVLTNSTLSNAYYSYDLVTPQQYQGAFYYKWIGSVILCVIANFKLKGKVQSDDNSLTKEYFLTHLEGEKSAAVYPKDPSKWLQAELNVFMEQIKKQNASRRSPAQFHGGEKPDLADIEMFGMTRVIDDHPLLHHVARQGDFGVWQDAMKKFYV